jgi:hypothetical protein
MRVWWYLWASIKGSSTVRETVIRKGGGTYYERGSFQTQVKQKDLPVIRECCRREDNLALLLTLTRILTENSLFAPQNRLTDQPLPEKLVGAFLEGP